VAGEGGRIDGHADLLHPSRRDSAADPGTAVPTAGSLSYGASTHPPRQALLGAWVVDRCGGIHPAWLPRAAGLCHGAGTSPVGEWQAQTPLASVGARGSSISSHRLPDHAKDHLGLAAHGMRMRRIVHRPTSTFGAPCVQPLLRTSCQAAPKTSPARTRRSGTPACFTRVPHRRIN
jgi:hypothetical protein